MYRLLKKGGLGYEADVSALLVSLGLRNDQTAFINVGANISYFPVLMGSIFKDAFEIHTFEPMPSLFEMGVKGLRRNGIDAVARPNALSDFVGQADFHLSASTDSSNSLNPTFRKSKSVITVDVTTLDEVFIRGGQSSIVNEIVSSNAAELGCTLVIDTESTEPDVLKGGEELIARTRPNIICEVLAGRTEDQLHAILERHHYCFYRLTADELVREAVVVGDRTYEHRDWFFAPAPVSPEIHRSYESLVGLFAT